MPTILEIIANHLTTQGITHSPRNPEPGYENLLIHNPKTNKWHCLIKQNKTTIIIDQLNEEGITTIEISDPEILNKITKLCK